MRDLLKRLLMDDSQYVQATILKVLFLGHVNVDKEVQGDSLDIPWYERGKILTYLNATCTNRAADCFVTKLGIDHLVKTAFPQNLLDTLVSHCHPLL